MHNRMLSVSAICAVAGLTASVSAQGLSPAHANEIDQHAWPGVDIEVECSFCGRATGRTGTIAVAHLVLLTSGTVTQSCAFPSEGIGIRRSSPPFKICQRYCDTIPEACPAITLNSTGSSFLPLGCVVLGGATTRLSDERDVEALGGCLIGPGMVLGGAPDRAFAEASYFVELGEGQIAAGRRASRSYINWAQDRLVGLMRECCGQDETVQEEIGLVRNETEFVHTVVPSVPGQPVTATVAFDVDTFSDTSSFNYGDDWDMDVVCVGPSSCVPPDTFSTVAALEFVVTPIGTGVTIVTPIEAQGLVITKPDGTFELVGALDVPGVNPLTGSGTFSANFQATGDITGLEVRTVIESLEEDDILSGDVDGDGVVCGIDRVVFMDALGLVINTPGAAYNIRADFDLDGDVDTDDLNHLNGIGCTADLDCDSVLTLFDQTTFSNAFAASLPLADWDGDGAFTIFDFTGFNSTYGLGCP